MPSLVKTVVVPYLNEKPDLGGIAGAMSWSELPPADSATELVIRRVAFDHPLFIMFSSGTTGVPKCIVHCHGGALLQHLKEHQLHSDVRPGDRLFYFTTCGWMMWNWLVSGLACGATLLLYDGSPFAGGGTVLFDYAAAERMTHFGTSAKFLDAAAKMGLMPGKTHDLASLRAMFSTGSPLSPEGFDWVYREIKQDILLASISGGTDIISCFVLGNPVLPVYRGEIQVAAWAWRSMFSTTMAVRCAHKRASWYAPGLSRRCRSASGTIPTARNTTLPISSASPTSGAMAISRN